MRLFLATAALTIVLGLGSAFSLADELSSGSVGTEDSYAGSSHEATSDVRAPDGGQFIKLDRALQRLELEAQLEEFYAELQARAQGLSEEERIRLYAEAEDELRQLVMDSESYAGQHRAKGLDYFQLARHVLAQHLGLDEIPA